MPSFDVTYPLSGEPLAVIYAGGFMWAVGVDGSGAVWKIRISDGAILAEYFLAGTNNPDQVTFDGFNLWISNPPLSVQVMQISDGTFVQNYAGLGICEALCYDGTDIWSANGGDGGTISPVYRIDASDGSIIATYLAGIAVDASAIIFDGIYIWVTDATNNVVYKIDDITGILLGTFNTGAAPESLCFTSDGHIWIANVGDGTVTVIDTAGGLVGTFACGSTPVSIATDGTYVWCANQGDGTVTQFALDGTVVATWTGGTQEIGIAYDNTSHMWLANQFDFDVAINDFPIPPAPTGPPPLIDTNSLRGIFPPFCLVAPKLII